MSYSEDSDVLARPCQAGRNLDCVIFPSVDLLLRALQNLGKLVVV